MAPCSIWSRRPRVVFPEPGRPQTTTSLPDCSTGSSIQSGSGVSTKRTALTHVAPWSQALAILCPPSMRWPSAARMTGLFRSAESMSAACSATARQVAGLSPNQQSLSRSAMSAISTRWTGSSLARRHRRSVHQNARPSSVSRECFWPPFGNAIRRAPSRGGERAGVRRQARYSTSLNGALRAPSGRDQATARPRMSGKQWSLTVTRGT